MGWTSFWKKVDDQVRNEASNLDDWRRENPLLSAGIPFTPENQALMAGGGAILGGGTLLGGLGAAGGAGAGATAGTAAAGSGGVGLGAMIGGSLLGAGASIYGANKGAKAQESAARDANAAQLQMYNQTREDQMPWMEQGKTSLAQLGGMMQPNGQLMHRFGMADFQKDPSYQFGMDEGMRALQNNAAMRGGMASGNALKALSKYGQDYAGTKYQDAYNRYNNDQTNIFNRLSGLAGTGQQTAQSLGSSGQNYANQFGQNVTNAGAARASGYQGQANAFNGMINNGMQLYGMNKQGFFS